MNEQINQSNLMNMSQAAKKLNVNYQTLVAAFRRGAIDGDKSKNLVDLESARQYFEGKNKVAFADLNLDFDEYLRPLDFISQNFNNQPHKLVTRQNYFITNKSKVYNSSLDKTMSPYLNEKGYLKVSLTGINSKINLRVHVLVALGFCPNRLGKSTVHHIDGNNQNNNANNLIWLTQNQHIEAHKLMNLPGKKAYKKFIGEMKKENSWHGEYRPIIIEKPDKTIFVWIAKDTWREYQNGLKTLDDIYYYDVGAEKTIYKEVVENESKLYTD